jgi:hypothetical protein
MSEPRGFWSYVHDDDQAEGERISRLARDVLAQFNMITGTSIDLFLDRDNLDWGEDWRGKIDESLSAIAFFIPVLTPRYFQSAECRRELNFFLRRADDLGVRDLMMPILYVDVAELHGEESSDPAISLARTYQWVDWTDLRFSDAGSGEYRRAVAGLASRLADATKRIEDVDVTGAALALEEDAEGEEPFGILDEMARAEEVIPQWVETMTLISQEIENVGEIMGAAAEEIDRGNAQGKGFAARLIIMRSVARDLDEPSMRIETYGNQFSTQLNEVDTGIRTVINRAPTEAAGDPKALAEATDFYRAIRELSESAEQGFDGLAQMVASIVPVENMSRDLRPSLRRLKKGLTLVTEGRKVIQEWVELMDETPLPGE